MTYDKSVVFSGSLINETDLHDITEILVKVALNTTTHNRIFVESGKWLDYGNLVGHVHIYKVWIDV